MLWANFVKLFSHLIAFTSLHRPFCFTLTFLEFVVKYPKTSSFFWMFLWRNSSLTKTTDSYSFILKKYLSFVNLCSITLSLNHSIMYAAVGAKKLANQKRKILLSMKTLLLLLTKSPKSPNTCFMSFFCFFFVFAFWPIVTTTANLQSWTHSNPSKSTKPSHPK